MIKVIEEFLDLQDSQDSLVLKEIQDPLDILEELEIKEILDLQVFQVNRDHLAHQEALDYRD